MLDMTALDIALYKRLPSKIILALIEMNANCHFDPLKESTLLIEYLKTESNKNSVAEVVPALMSQRVILSRINDCHKESGMTALMCAITHSMPVSVVEALLNAGAKVGIKNKKDKGHDALTYAMRTVEQNSASTLPLLFRYNINQERVASLLSEATVHGYYHVVAFFLSKAFKYQKYIIKLIQKEDDAFGNKTVLGHTLSSHEFKRTDSIQKTAVYLLLAGAAASKEDATLITEYKKKLVTQMKILFNSTDFQLDKKKHDTAKCLLARILGDSEDSSNGDDYVWQGFNKARGLLPANKNNKGSQLAKLAELKKNIDRNKIFELNPLVYPVGLSHDFEDKDKDEDEDEYECKEPLPYTKAKQTGKNLTPRFFPTYPDSNARLNLITFVEYDPNKRLLTITATIDDYHLVTRYAFTDVAGAGDTLSQHYYCCAADSRPTEGIENIKKILKCTTNKVTINPRSYIPSSFQYAGRGITPGARK